MGRHYSGDITGKFAFGVQSSNDASFFGGSESEPAYLEYYFDCDDLPDIKAGVEKCKLYLGENEKRIDLFFDEHDSYNDMQLAEYLGISISKKEAKIFAVPKVSEILSWYARLKLGEKILTCVEQTGQCSFEAEL